MEPIDGIDLMQENRQVKDLKNLTNGPGKLTKAMNITMKQKWSRFNEGRRVVLV
ncbi:MAG: DNA-3-methyladenine glycosylase [Nitrososphaerales archaeon]